MVTQTIVLLSNMNRPHNVTERNAKRDRCRERKRGEGRERKVETEQQRKEREREREREREQEQEQEGGEAGKFVVPPPIVSISGLELRGKQEVSDKLIMMINHKV